MYKTKHFGTLVHFRIFRNSKQAELGLLYSFTMLFRQEILGKFLPIYNYFVLKQSLSIL